MLGTAKPAVEQGLRNIIVSNGYMSRDCLDELGPYLHAANIDLKSFSDAFYRERCQARLQPVLRTLKHIRELGWWLEVTTLLIPDLNDSAQELEQIAGFIHDELGPEVPWHVSRFHPTHRLTDRGSTPVRSLERALAVGRKAGLRYVYIGNVAGHAGDNTYCHKCGELLIERVGFLVRSQRQACDSCGEPLAGIFA
jgi:pyruvate formate lyase activating enzyme